MKTLVPYFRWMKIDIHEAYFSECPRCKIDFKRYPHALSYTDQYTHGTIRRVLCHDLLWFLKGGIRYEWIRHNLLCKNCGRKWKTPYYPTFCTNKNDIRKIYDIIFDSNYPEDLVVERQ